MEVSAALSAAAAAVPWLRNGSRARLRCTEAPLWVLAAYNTARVTEENISKEESRGLHTRETGVGNTIAQRTHLTLILLMAAAGSPVFSPRGELLLCVV